jgi:broad specificity phosphatase PhoE
MPSLASNESTEIWLIRHGETAWSRSGQHTSRTDIPLTPAGEASAHALRERLKGIQFGGVLTSPSLRALDTCRLAGFAWQARIEPNLSEWNYGIYEGKRTAEIQSETPGWSVWTAPIPDGESLDQVAARANQVIETATGIGGRVALFAHAHILRILATCWIGNVPSLAQNLILSTGSISVLGYERSTRAITRWNCV